MANFKTHLLIAATVSGLASVAIIATGIAAPVEVGRYFSLGVTGGLLPDIDSDHSVPTQIFFNFLALSGAFGAVLWALPAYSFVELGVLWVTIFLLIRYAIFEAFIRLTVHRGVFHSMLASVFFGLLTINISYHLFGCSILTSWMSGCFISLGYLLHLCLDEFYSVDLMNRRMKKSFGTAMKPISINNMKASFLMLLLTLGLYGIRPDIKPFWIQVTTTVNRYSAESKWFPKSNQWFSGLPRRLMSYVRS